MKTLSSFTQRPEQLICNLSQCHQWMAFSRPSSHKNYHIDFKLCLLEEWLEDLSPRRMALSSVSWRPEQLICNLSQCHQWMAFSRPSSHKNYHIDFKLCLLEEWLEDLSPRRMALSSVSWRPEQLICRVFPCVTNAWPFQEHLTKTMI